MTARWLPKAFVPAKGPSSLAAMQWVAALRASKLGLRTHLVVFGLAIVVPVLLYSGFLLHRFTQAERESNERRALTIARALSADVDRELTAIITTLETLATSRALTAGDYATFHAQAKEALKSRSWNVVLIDAAGQQRVNTRLPWGTALPLTAATEPPLPQIVRQTEQPYISDLFVGTVAKRQIFAVAVPVRIGEEAPSALVMSLEPERLVEVLNEGGIPDGWLAAISDRNNINMARSRFAARFVGQRVPSESLRQYAGRPEGVITTTDFEGQHSLHAFHFSRLSGWRMAAWAPLPVVEAPLRQAWTLFLTSGAVLLSLSLLGALGLGRLMAAPIAELRRAGTALGQGQPVEPFSSTLREADELSLVLARASEELNARMGAQAHLAAIVSSSPSAMVSLSPDGIIRSWNPAAQNLFGYAPDEVIGKSVRIFYGDDSHGDFEVLNESIRNGESVHGDVVRRHKDGRLIDVSISVAPMYEESGRLVGISAIIRDISERKGRERHIEFLMRELSHRSKNLLAVVQAISGQTARYSPDLEAFQKRFSQRLAAMARSQDLMVAHNWRGAPMSELVRSQLAPFVEENSPRVEMTGPALELTPNAAHGLTLALHELATNAAKYGALSVPEGKVAITWELTGSGTEDSRFRMSWRESGGPPVTPPTAYGFGHTVIEQMVASSLRGEVTLDYAREGLLWSLDAPSTHLVAAGKDGL